MTGVTNGHNWNRVLIDVCTQRDYLESGAILQVANVETLLANLRGIFEWADARQVAVVSALESHRPTEPANGFPMHCVDNTPGQEKISFSLLSPWVVVENDNYLSLPPDLRKNFRQLIFRKRTPDILSNPKADRFLTQIEPDEFIIFGVGLERSIRSLALGLLSRHKRVAVVSDACGYWSEADSELALRQLAAKGVRLVPTAELTAPEPAPRRFSLRRVRRRRRRGYTRIHAPSAPGAPHGSRPDPAGA
jgi:nicotinamidase-related amidase